MSSAQAATLHPPALALVGPTASGKTALAFDLVDRFPMEIVSLDSAQVFSDMNIGTAKPDAATLARYPHRLIDLVTPEQRYSAACFRRDALAAMADIAARGRIPLLVGGTLLYYKALVEGLADLPPADTDLRAAIDAAARASGWPAVHAELARLDPEAAARLAPNDGQRIQRALEVVRLTGQPLASFWQAQPKPELPFRLYTLAIVAGQRGELHARIAQRFRTMLASGLVEETRQLRQRYRLAGDLPSMRCVGYRQVWEMLEGRLPAAELADRGIFATRQLAKRQLTWLRGLRDAGRLDLEVDLADLADTATPARIRAKVEQHLAAASILFA